MIKRKSILKMFLVNYIFLCPLSSFSYSLMCSATPPIPCMTQTCDSVLRDAMGKQKKTLEARLEDLVHTIEANTKQTLRQTKIIEQEVLAYTRLLERVKLENIALKKAVHLSKKIKESESLGTTIKIIGKGKQ